MSYVRCVCGAVYNTVGTTTGMSGCCPKCGLHHSGQYRVAKPILKPSPLAAKPIEEEGRMSGNLVENGKEYICRFIGESGQHRAVYERTECKPLVRCWDCAYAVDNDWFGYLQCNRPDEDGGYLRVPTEPNGFCKWGERRSE